MPTDTESPFDAAYSEASRLTLTTLVPGVEYSLVRNFDNSDAGRVDCFFADPSDARRYARRLSAAFAAGALGDHFHPAPKLLDLHTFTVTRWT